MPFPQLVLLVRHGEALLQAAYPPRIDAIYASDPVTVEPLATALGVAIDTSHTQERPLALRIRKQHAGQIVLVCWHHAHIPKLVTHLGLEAAPGPWDERDVDSVWELRFDSVGRAGLRRTTQTELTARRAR